MFKRLKAEWVVKCPLDNLSIFLAIWIMFEGTVIVVTAIKHGHM